MIPEPTEAMLPCPFCGPRPEESGEWPQLFEHSSVYVTEYSVRCGRCGIEMADEQRETAIAAWNTREPEADKLREALHPFALIGSKLTVAGGWADADEIELTTTGDFRVFDKVPVSAFRRALTALSRNQGR